MSIDRLTRVNELLKREIAEALYRHITQDGFDMSAVTVTRVIVSSNLRSARVHVSIRDHEEDRGSMMRVLHKNAQSIQQHLRKTITLKYIPRLQFEYDESIESGDRVLHILDQLEAEEKDRHPEHGEETDE